MNLIERVKHARRAGVPLLAINTPDPRATMEMLSSATNEETPVLCWDCVAGVRPVNDAGRQVIASIDTEQAEGNPMGFLEVASELPDGTVVCFLQADAWIVEPPVIQGVWNLRDPYKTSRRMLVLLGSQINLPTALQRDVVILDEELPNREELTNIVREMDEAASEAAPERPRMDEDSVRRSADAVQGLSAFLAEQAVAMSLRRDGIDVDHLWENRRSMIEQTKGLSVDREKVTFDDVGGLRQAKGFGRALFDGPHPPSVVVRIEEIEKVMAGATGDLSGTSQDALQVVLNSMEDHGWAGIIAFGCPGAGKSLYAKALANTFGVLSLSLDLNATKGSLVGESEKSVREAMQVIHAVGGENVFCVATANRLNTLPGELKRRFRYGVWMFDFPSDEERRSIWPIHRRKFEIDKNDRTPDDGDYAGSDVRNCCELAWRMGCSLREAARFVGPVGKVASDVIRDARKLADGRFLDAAHPGLYRSDKQTGVRRTINM